MIKKVSKNEMRKVRHERIRENLSGTSERPRLCVFRSNANIEAQIIDDVKGVTLVSATTLEKDLKIKKFSMLNNEDIKKVISQLSKSDISFSNLIITGDEIPKNVELFMSETKEWKSIENINKGDIAKKSIEYY